MPFSGASRWFLSAALAHLSAAGALVLLGSTVGVPVFHWNGLVWLILIGFVGCTTLGFSLHLFPTVSRRLLPRGLLEWAVLVTSEAAVVLGSTALYGAYPTSIAMGLFSVAAGLFLTAIGLVLLLFATTLARPRLKTADPERRPGDVVTVPLFLMAWTAALGAGGLFFLSGGAPGPGFGWWIAAVHVFVLGHATLLIAAVSLRLVPRSLGADPPRWAAIALAALGGTGAALVPTGMLLLPPDQAGGLLYYSAPEAAFALFLVAVLIHLGTRATTPRRQLGLHLGAVGLLVTGGGIGLWMVSRASYALVETHALVNVLGFTGLTILIMWFGMIGPFQRISHAWTRRMLWTLSATWIAGVLALAWSGWPSSPAGPMILGGTLVLGVAIAWGTGTIPVLFPQWNPLPGLAPERIHAMRERWSRR